MSQFSFEDTELWTKAHNIINEGSADIITSRKKTNKIMNLFAVEVLPLVVQSIFKILSVEEEISENKQHIVETQHHISPEHVLNELTNKEED